jgi:hypothetical protein
MSKRTVDYKHSGVRDLAPDPAAITAMPEGRNPSLQAKSALPLEGRSTPRQAGGRIPAKVPVIHRDGTPLMPCSPAKARKLIQGGVAEGR